MVTAKTPGVEACLSFLWPFVFLVLFICCCLHSGGVKGSTLPPLSPGAQRGEEPEKSVPPPLPPIVARPPPLPIWGVYYCE